ncbi:hypothetical protein TCA2_4582 [Paenibacillus sp. TCA20]|uniref:Transcription elongation factor GreA/GreB C-terminal domain-containing protein n=1 Tax=Paenibacillus urinalis TaxID=521520 RepID=A0ABY7XHK0_9BACL|nr:MULTISPECIES: hypothetical protein [Paenibacillus]WDI05083.1 hypothetical protein PUW25_26295 [Paenibacillus urinalis]GAK42090.1 hypothetical protein TCA2_4582 [Paenibacillus sp. TCA20]
MDQIKIMANTPDQNRNYLRTYLQEEISQKIRLEETIKLYEVQLDELTEEVVDQAETMRAMKNDEMADKASSRLSRMELMKFTVQKYLQHLKERNHEMVEDSQAHMVALSEIEIEQGGFVALLFGLRDNVEFEPVSQGLTFEPGGSVESIIGTSLTSWKDSSQLKITLIREGN